MRLNNRALRLIATCWATAVFAGACIGDALAQSGPLTGTAAFGDWRADKPGVSRLIKAEDLPRPGATPSSANVSRVVPRPAAAFPQVPDGFKIELFAEGLNGPRQMRVAPNGDIFVAETSAGRIRILRAADGDSKPSANEIYASALNGPFGIAFYPRGSNPQWIYVANIDSVIRFPYRVGDLKAAGKAETVVARLPHGYGHSTRDIAFTNDDKRMLVSVGSAGNDGEGMGSAPGGLQPWIREHPLGASWRGETDRAAVLMFDPDGKRAGLFATGIRNCVGLAVHPAQRRRVLLHQRARRHGRRSGARLCYARARRRVLRMAMVLYRSNEDPRHAGKRPDLTGKSPFPTFSSRRTRLRWDLHSTTAVHFRPNIGVMGSRPSMALGTGPNARATKSSASVSGMECPPANTRTLSPGLSSTDSEVWGRPVGVAVAHDGALLVSEDGNGTIWRIARQ